MAKNPHATALSKLGAAKGGRARAERIDSERRREIAVGAAIARWGKEVPFATHDGSMIIADYEISCAVLNNGTRVLSQQTFLKAIGRARAAKGGTGSAALAPGQLPPFLAAENLRPFVPDELWEHATPVEFRARGGAKAYGYNAMLLPMVCEVYLRARDAGLIRKRQRHIAEACDLLMRGLARVGIIALVDEATGYQEDRARNELQKILARYIAHELMPWVKRFPDEFFRHIYRLQDWEYRPGTAKRTPQVGKIINKYIYEELPPGVLEELRRKNPVTEKGYRARKHHQYLTEHTGHPHLDRQITAIMTLMAISESREEFESHFRKAFGKPIQGRLPLVVPMSDDAEEISALPSAPAPLS